MSGRNILATLGKEWGFPGIGPPPTFWPLWFALELSRHLWVCHLACWCLTVSIYWGSRSSGSQLICHLGPIRLCPRAMSFIQRFWYLSQGGSAVKNLPLEKEMATHSRILAWDIPWTEESGEQQSRENRKSQAGLSYWTTNTFLIPEGTEILITRNRKSGWKACINKPC